MVKNPKTDAQARKEAEELVRRILTDFGQKVDKKTVVEVAARVRQSLPRAAEREKVSA